MGIKKPTNKGKHGGKRPNAGRRSVPKVSQPAVNQDVAAEILGGIDQHAYWREFLHANEDLKRLTAAARGEVERTLHYLTNRAHGKPCEKTIIQGGDKPIGIVSTHIDLSNATDADLIRAEEVVRRLAGIAAEPGGDSERTM